MKTFFKALFVILMNGFFIFAFPQDLFCMDGEEALRRLIEGNQRFMKEPALCEENMEKQRQSVSMSQSPFAVIVGCADSRVPPEIIFDQGLGDLFVVRSAGNIVDDVALGSTEYAIENLGASIIVVLGHQRCGAVSAALSGIEFKDHIQNLVSLIQQNLKDFKKTEDNLEDAIKINVQAIVQQLKISKPVIEKRLQEGTITIVGAYYSLDSGKVEFLK